MSGSNFGVMCELAAITAHTSVPCRVCEGQGFRVLDLPELEERARRLAQAEPTTRAHLREAFARDSTCAGCGGSGYTTPKRADRGDALDPMWTTVRCSRCRGSGETVHPNDESAETEDVCPKCRGDGYRVPHLVRPKGGAPRGGGSSLGAVDDGGFGPADVGVTETELLDLAERSRVLDRVRARDATAAAVYEAFHGPDGDRWAQHRWGRLFAVWPLTRAGKLLAEGAARRSKGGSGYLMSALTLLASERDAELRAERPNPRRRALLSQADAQARQLLRRAQEAVRAEEEAIAV